MSAYRDSGTIIDGDAGNVFDELLQVVRFWPPLKPPPEACFMYKTLCIAVLLLATFAFTSGSKPADASATGLPSPVIVAKVVLTNQTEIIPTSTIVTVTKTGLFRVSAYMTAITQSQGTHVKYLHLNWNDDAGPESLPYEFLVLDNSGAPPNAYGVTPDGINVVNNFTLRAVAGTPISYSVSVDNNSPGGTYDLYIVVEHLI